MTIIALAAGLAPAAVMIWKPAIAQWAHDKIASLGAGRGGQ